MSSVPTSITSALESISTSCGDVIRDVGEFTPSVMAPETLVLNNHDKIINKIRTVFDAVTFTGGPEADLTPEQEADNAISALSAHAGAVTRIAEKIAAAMFSVAASDRALIESAVQFKTNAMQTKVKTATDCIGKQVATAVRVEQKRVRDSDKGDYHLKINGYSGRTEEEARTEWLQANDLAIERYSMVKRCEREITRNMDKATRESDPTKAAEQEKAIAARNSNLENKLKHLKARLYEGVSKEDGLAVEKSTGAVPAIPLPRSMDPPDRENRKKYCTEMLQWLQRPEVIKRYNVIVHDVKHMIENINPIECIHEKPPDKREGWKDPPLSFPLDTNSDPNETTESIRKEYREAQKQQWRLLYESIVTSTVATNRRVDETNRAAQ